MREVIQKVMATEAEAKRLVQAAKVEAERILSAAQKRALERTTTARQEGQLAAQEILATATKDAGQEKQARLTTVAVEIETQVHLDEATRQQAVAAVVRCVCS